MGGEEIRKMKGSLALAVLMVFICTIVLSASTFAWFTFQTATNITPMSGTVGTGGADLLISNYPDSGFAASIELAAYTSDNLRPVSTSNLENFYESVRQNGAGISNGFQSVNDRIDTMTVNGTLYLKSENSACDVYFNTEAMSFGTDVQALSAYRLGLVITTVTEGTRTYIFNLDSFGNTGGAQAVRTMSEGNVVISGLNGSSAITVADPSVSISDYAAAVNGDSVAAGANKLMSLVADEVATVRYRLYIEGCDDNSSNAVQGADIALQLGFAGVGPGL